MSNLYANKVRVRICGILIESDRLLLINHKGIGTLGNLWAPPGGGLEFGESAEACLEREFLEETGLEIHVGPFLFVNEYQNGQFHAVELFFKVENRGGTLIKGSDPELKPENQIISKLKFVTYSELQVIRNEQKHNMLWKLSEINDLLNISGYFKFCE
ncbi:MAG: NUDIX domain-containing protein [Bacteroidota bacterium]